MGDEIASMRKDTVIIVLGYRLADNGKPEKELKGRTNKGIEVFRKGLAEKMIHSGGMVNLKARKTEAKSMADITLYNNDISAENIILEEKSLDTIGNAYFSKKIVKNNWNKIYVVTSCYHMPRASFIFDMCHGSNYTLNYNYCYEEKESYDKIESERKKFKVVKSLFKGMEPGDDKEIEWRIFNKHKLYKDKLRL